MHDLRMALPALVAWGAAACLVTLSSYVSVLVAIAAIVCAAALTRWRPRGGVVWLLAAVCLVAISVSLMFWAFISGLLLLGGAHLSAARHT